MGEYFRLSWWKGWSAKFQKSPSGRTLVAVGLTIWILLSWKSNLEEAVLTAHQIGSVFGIFAPILIPYLGPALTILGVLIILFVPVEQHPASRIIADSAAYLAAALGLVVLGALVVLSFGSVVSLHLSSKQSQALKRVLSTKPDIANRIWIASYPECFKCRAYAWEFATAMNEIPTWPHKVGVLPFEQVGGMQLSTLWRGVIVGTKDPRHLTDDQETLVAALKMAHISYTFEPLNFVIIKPDGSTFDALVLMVAPPTQE